MLNKNLQSCFTLFMFVVFREMTNWGKIHFEQLNQREEKWKGHSKEKYMAATSTLNYLKKRKL